MSTESKLAQILSLLESAPAPATFEGRAMRQERTTPIDLGKTLGSWRVVSRRFGVPVKTVGFRAGYLCECVCGVVRPVYEFQLRDGTSTSCGCQQGASMIKTRAANRKRK